MDFTTLKKLNIGGIGLVQLFINGVQVWKSGPKNWVKYSTEADGVTIYNGGLGYKDGYRVRSGGAEGAQVTASCIGFIPFKKGDVLRIYPAFTGMNAVNAINFADASFTNLGQRTDNGGCYGICSTNSNLWKECETAVDGVSVVDISDIPNAGDVAYVRISNNIGDIGHKITTGADMIVTVNEEIK